MYKKWRRLNKISIPGGPEGGCQLAAVIFGKELLQTCSKVTTTSEPRILLQAASGSRQGGGSISISNRSGLNLLGLFSRFSPLVGFRCQRSLQKVAGCTRIPSDFRIIASSSVASRQLQASAANSKALRFRSRLTVSGKSHIWSHVSIS